MSDNTDMKNDTWREKRSNGKCADYGADKDQPFNDVISRDGKQDWWELTQPFTNQVNSTLFLFIRNWAFNFLFVSEHPRNAKRTIVYFSYPYSIDSFIVNFLFNLFTMEAINAFILFYI